MAEHGDRRDEGAEPPLAIGKLPPTLLTSILAGACDDDTDVLVGPTVGEDAAAITVPAGTMVVATDPVTLTGRDIGRFAAVVNANDVAVLGVRPSWFLACLLVPAGTTAPAVTAIMRGLRSELDHLGVTLVGGHTEVTHAVTRPVLVGQAIGVAPEGDLVRTAGAQPGDAVVQVGAAPIEGAAVLADAFADRLAALDPSVVGAARAAADDPGITVVDAALASARMGATAMHDPTEGGLAAGLHEIATAAGVCVTVDAAAVRWFAPGVAVCAALGADPWATLASGALLATFPRSDVGFALESLVVDGHDAALIGAIEVGSGVARRDGEPLPWPDRDEVARLLS